MVGAISISSSLADPNSSPCLLLDLPSSSTLHIKNKLEVGIHTSSTSKKQLRKPCSLDLRSSFVGRLRVSGLVNRCPRKQRKLRQFRIVDELGGQYEEGFNDVTKQIINYFTQKAVKTVMYQLYEMNPTQYTWFYNFMVTNHPGDGKRFLQKLGKEKQELAERVMVTRLHLYAKWIKKCDHAAIYKEISDQNLELMRERLLETIVWPPDDTNLEKIG